MTTDAPTKTFEAVSIRKAENGFMLIVSYKTDILEMPDGVSMDSDEMSKWHLQNDIMIHNNQPKTYVFSSFKDLTTFIEIQTGWS